MSIYEMSLDLKKSLPIYSDPIVLRQGDTNVEILVHVFDNSTPKNLENLHIEFHADKPDATTIDDDEQSHFTIGTDKESFTYTVPDELTDASGSTTNTYFKIGNDSTSDFYIHILTKSGMEKLESGDYISKVDRIFNHVMSDYAAINDISATGKGTFDTALADSKKEIKDLMDNLNAEYVQFINSKTTDFNTFLANLDSQATDVKTKYTTLKTQLDALTVAKTGPKGDKGDIGPQGPKGDKGDKGDTGSVDNAGLTTAPAFVELQTQVDNSAVGTNLYQDTRDFDNPSLWPSLSNWFKTGEKFNGLTIMGMNTDWGGLGQIIQAKKGETYTFSVYARYESGIGKSTISTAPWHVAEIANPASLQVSLDTTWKRVSLTVVATADGELNMQLSRSEDNKNILLIAGIKLEKGPTATDYSVNPLDYLGSGDVQTAITSALSNVKTGPKGDKGDTPDLSNYTTVTDLNNGLSTKVTDNKNGTIEVNGNSITPADNSKVVHSTDLSNYVTEISVKSFGAVGDGINDDTSAIQNAINYANKVGGGIVSIPAGAYKLTGGIQIFSNISIKGAGTNATILNQTSANDSHIRGNDVNNIDIEDMKLQGLGIDSVGGGGIYLARTNNDNIDGVYMKNVVVSGCAGGGISISCPIVSTFINVTVLGVVGDGFAFYKSGTSVSMIGCYAITCTKAGFHFDQMNYCSFSGCATEVCGIGYYFSSSCNNVTLQGCGSEDEIKRSDEMPGVAYQFDGGNGNSLISCYSRGTASAAIKINYSSPTIIGFRQMSGSAGIISDSSSKPLLANNSFADSVSVPDEASVALADKLSSARKINGVSFDGSSDITVPDIILSGSTSNRPTGESAGYQYFDTTLNKPIWYTGKNWVDSTGTTV